MEEKPQKTRKKSGNPPSKLDLDALSKLKSFGRLITDRSSAEPIHLVFDREDILKRIFVAISLGKRHVLLVGESGCGKSAVIQGLASWIVSHDPRLPSGLGGMHVVEFTMNSFVSGCSLLGDIEKRIAEIMNAADRMKAIVVIDNLHHALTAGMTQRDEYGSVANRLMEFLEHRKMPIIATTTVRGFQLINRSHPSFASEFKREDIIATTPEQTAKILVGMKSHYESRYGIAIPDSVIDHIVDVADRIKPNRAFPGKAFETLEASLLSHVQKEQIIGDNKGMMAATESSSEEQPISAKKYSSLLSLEDILDQIRNTGLSERFVNPSYPMDSIEIERFLLERVYGQPEAVRSVCGSLIRFKNEWNHPQKPVGTYLYIGPSGVGKTCMARAIGDFLYDGEKKPIFIYKMEEYSHPSSIRDFLGGDDFRPVPGRLLDDVGANPFCVVVLDEIDKASQAVRDALLGILDENKDNAFDAASRTSFRNVLIIMTSNTGAELFGCRNIGFRGQKEQEDVPKSEIQKIVERDLGKAFINRVTMIVPFYPLTRDTMRIIVLMEINNFMSRKGFQKSGVDLSDKEKIAETILMAMENSDFGFECGARRIQVLVEEMLTDICTERLKSKASFRAQ